MANVMFDSVIHVDSLDTAWMIWYEELTKNIKNGKAKKSRDGNVVGEIINATTVIKDPTKNIMNNPIRNLSMRYAIGELLWYLSASNKVSTISRYTKVWERMSDDGITINSNYGYCIKNKYGFDQWEYVKNLLIEQPETRQAVIHIKDADNKESKDVNCTVCLQFFIRETEGVKKLYCTSYMRSNDLWMGFPYDVFQFTCMQIRMAMELDIEVGTYTHHAGSLHLYERDWKKSLEEARKAGMI